MKKKDKQSAFKIFNETESLNFKCTGCGKCCTGSPGYVWLSEKDILRISTKLSLNRKEFLEKYTVFIKNKYSLKDIAPSYDCIFFRDKKCTIYDARPNQCRSYPFWDSILGSKKKWNEEKSMCEGIDHKDAKEFSSQEIQTMLDSLE